VLELKEDIPAGADVEEVPPKSDREVEAAGEGAGAPNAGVKAEIDESCDGAGAPNTGAEAGAEESCDGAGAPNVKPAEGAGAGAPCEEEVPLEEVKLNPVADDVLVSVPGAAAGAAPAKEKLKPDEEAGEAAIVVELPPKENPFSPIEPATGVVELPPKEKPFSPIEPAAAGSLCVLVASAVDPSLRASQALHFSADGSLVT